MKDSLKKVEVIVIRNPDIIGSLEGLEQQKEIHYLDETVTLEFVNGDELGNILIDQDGSQERRFWYRVTSKGFDIISDNMVSHKSYIRTTSIDKAYSVLEKTLEQIFPLFEITTLEKTEVILLY